MRTFKHRIAVLLWLTIAAAVCCQAGEVPADLAEAKPAGAKKRRPMVTISKETTRITSPLRKDGYVDYVAALSAICSEGVTPQNNAVVALWRAMGPGEIDEGIRRRYFRMLGIRPLPLQGDYIVSFEDYLADRGVEEDDETYRQFHRSIERTWTGKECPLVADWLKANEKPLAHIVAASRCPRYYSPLISDDDTAPLATAQPTAIWQMHSVARMLTARAMFCVGQGKLDEARHDLLACHRLGRLCGQGPTLTDALVGIAVDGMACRGDTALVQSGRLTAEQALKYRAELRKLAPLPRTVDKIDTAERFMFLDSVSGIARNIPQAIRQRYLGKGNALPKTTDQLLDWYTRVAIDWDQILRMGNWYYDRAVEAARKPTRAGRLAASDEIDKEIGLLFSPGRDLASIAKTVLTGRTPRQMATHQIGGRIVWLMKLASSAIVDAEHRGTMRMEVTQLAFVLAAYHGNHGSYPAKLEELAPKYIDAVPTDVFSDGPLRYRCLGNGCLVYSVGRNGEDDGGRNRNDDPQAEDDLDHEGDDIAVRMAGKKR